MSKITLQIITPEDMVYDGLCYSVNLPGSQGRFEVLEGHMNMVSSLEDGVVEIRELDGRTIKRLEVSDGFADVSPKRCIVMIESARAI